MVSLGSARGKWKHHQFEQSWNLTKWRKWKHHEFKQSWAWTYEENESNIFDKMPLEILEKIFVYAVAQSGNTFPGHLCCTVQSSVAAIPRFNAFREKAMGFLHRLYVNDHTVFPKDKRAPGEIHVNVKRLSQFLGVHSGIIMEVRCIINNPRWYWA